MSMTTLLVVGAAVMCAVGAVVINAIMTREVEGWMPLIARAVVRAATRLIPAEHRHRYQRDWIADVAHYDDRPITALAWALDCFRAAVVERRGIQQTSALPAPPAPVVAAVEVPAAVDMPMVETPPLPRFPRAALWGVPLVTANLSRVMDWMDSAVVARHPVGVLAGTPELMGYARRDPSLRSALAEEDIVVFPDRRLSAALRALGHRSTGVDGADLLEEYCRRAAQTGVRMYVYGEGSAGELLDLATYLGIRYPGIRLVGSSSARDTRKASAAAAAINRSHADIVWFALKVRREPWIAEVRSRIHAPVVASIGDTAFQQLSRLTGSYAGPLSRIERQMVAPSADSLRFVGPFALRLALGSPVDTRTADHSSSRLRPVATRSGRVIKGLGWIVRTYPFLAWLAVIWLAIIADVLQEVRR